MDLNGRVAVVTGGGTGIGRATAQRLVRAGARGVLLTWSRSADDAEQTVKDLTAAGAEAEAVQVDVRDDAAVRAMARRCEDRFGRCDLLVNNAGTTRWLDFADLDALTDEVWEEVLGVNLLGAFRCARALEPALRERRGAVVNVASISGHRGVGSSIPYGVSKAALVQLTRSLAVVLGPQVRVNSVSPGTVATRWQLDQFGDEGFAERAEAERAVSPLARTPGPDDVADAILGLLGSDVVTGVDVVVDSGKHLLY